MGANQSQSQNQERSHESQDQVPRSLQDFLHGSSKGLHILSLKQALPASRAGLEPFFDFITHVDGERVRGVQEWSQYLDMQYYSQSQHLNPSSLKPLHLIVYSSKSTSLRNVSIFPVLALNSTNEVGGSRITIGANVKDCDFANVHERVWHVLEVVPGSPAALSGLVAESDYIVGSRDGDGSNALIDKNDFGALVALFEHKQLHLWVYSISLDTIREVVLVPDSSWGGEGMLGCDIGYGNTHRISLGLQRREEESQQKLILEMEEKSKEERHTADHRHSSSKGAVVFEKHPSFPTGLSGSRSGSHSHSHGSHSDTTNEHPSHQHASHTDTTDQHPSHQHASHSDTTNQHSSHHHHESAGHAHADGSIHYGSHVGDESTPHHHSAEKQRAKQEETVNHLDIHQIKPLNHRGSEDTLAAAAVALSLPMQASTKKRAV